MNIDFSKKEIKAFVQYNRCAHQAAITTGSKQASYRRLQAMFAKKFHALVSQTKEN